MNSSFLFFLSFLFITERQTETEHEHGRGTERDRGEETESEAGCRLWAVSTEPDAGLELTEHEIITWAEVGHYTDWATQSPQSNSSKSKRILKMSSPHFVRDIGEYHFQSLPLNPSTASKGRKSLEYCSQLQCSLLLQYRATSSNFLNNSSKGNSKYKNSIV